MSSGIITTSPYDSWHRRPSSMVAMTSVMTIVTTISSYYLYQCVSHYGWEGTFWYLWEGDPYPPEARQDFHTLKEIEESLQSDVEELLDRLEVTYEKAQLDCVDQASAATINAAWNSNLLSTKSPGGNYNLERTLARLSHELDQYAAQVDAVPSKKHPDLKPHKKALSNRIVQLMQRLDVFVGYYKQEEQDNNKGTTTN